MHLNQMTPGAGMTSQATDLAASTWRLQHLFGYRVLAALLHSKWHCVLADLHVERLCGARQQPGTLCGASQCILAPLLDP